VKCLPTLLIAFSLVLSAAAPAAAQDLLRKAPPQDRPILITGADVHPVSGPVIESGAVYFDRGVIRAVMTADEADRWRRSSDRPVNLRVIDASGKRVYPGLIGANTVTGLMEIGAVGVTVDVNEQGSITPEARAISSVNPDSTLIPVTRLAGVLTTGVMPSGGVVPGRAAVIRMDGWTWEDMAVKADAGLIVAWPNLRPISAWWMTKSPEEQRREALESRQSVIDLLDAAEAYLAAREADPDGVPLDMRFEAMRPSMNAETPVFVRAQELEQIQDAVSVLAERGFDVVVVGGRDAPLCADLLKAHDVAVMITGTHTLPARRDAVYDDPFTLPNRLEQAGLRWCLATSGGTFQTPHERNLPHHAATAVAYGLPHDAALRSITLSAAELLGVEDKLGSIEPGKLATIIITDGDPLEITTRVTQAFIDGREIDLRSKQTELYEKYREKYRQLESINDKNAPPGSSRP